MPWLTTGEAALLPLVIAVCCWSVLRRVDRALNIWSASLATGAVQDHVQGEAPLPPPEVQDDGIDDIPGPLTDEELYAQQLTYQDTDGTSSANVCADWYERDQREYDEEQQRIQARRMRLVS